MYPKPPAPASFPSPQSHQTRGRNNNNVNINGDVNSFYNSSISNAGSHSASHRSLAGEGGVGGSSWSPPPAFLQHFSSSDSGTAHKGGESYNNPQAICSHGYNQSRLNSQLSFTKHGSIDHHLSSDHPSLKRSSTSSHPSSSSGFTVSRWEEECKSLLFDTSSSNPQIDLSEIGTIDNSRVPENSVAWRVRAKRGCATHPRSIAERERRIRISCKLKKLQELVPNIDKQTSYAELLDLAVQHIEDLQCQLQKLDEELSSCTCGCKHDE